MNPMRQFRLMMIATLALVFCMSSGCGSNNKDKLEGTSWISKPGQVGEEKIKKGDVILDFDKEGMMRAKTFGTFVRGKYTLGSSDTVMIEFDHPVLGEKTHRVRISVEEDTLTFRDSSGSIEFTREKPADEAK